MKEIYILNGVDLMKYYIVDAFTEKLFKGNQAGVCLLDKWPDDSVMQNIAAENNLAETAFIVQKVMIMSYDGSLLKLKLIYVVMQLWQVHLLLQILLIKHWTKLFFTH